LFDIVNEDYVEQFGRCFAMLKLPSAAIAYTHIATTLVSRIYVYRTCTLLVDLIITGTIRFLT